MNKKSPHYSILTKKELEYIKDIYIKEKVSSMSNKELKDFVQENINLQMHNTIGHEEELEAWKEMESFFNQGFESIIEKVKQKFKCDNESDNYEIDENQKRQEILETRLTESEKMDMWED